MYKIDLKDRKILFELDSNCRNSNTQIGKRVGLKKDVVSYRINKMINDGLIKNFWAEINTFKLGYNVYRIYINFQDVSSDVKKEIIQYFTDCKTAWAVMSVTGPIDLDVMVWVKDSLEFQQFWNQTLDKYGSYFSDHSVSVLTGGTAFYKTFLLNEEYKETDRKFFNLVSGGKTVETDEIDYKLLNILSNNARAPLIKLAEELNCSSQTITYRINNLVKNGVILAFRVGIDMSLLGYQNSVIDIYLNDHSKKKKIIDYLKFNPYILYFVDAIGWCDIQFEIMVKSIDHLNDILEEINTKFPGVVRKKDFWISKKYYHLRSLPELY